MVRELGLGSCGPPPGLRAEIASPRELRPAEAGERGGGALSPLERGETCPAPAPLGPGALVRVRIRIRVRVRVRRRAGISEWCGSLVMAVPHTYSRRDWSAPMTAHGHRPSLPPYRGAKPSPACAVCHASTRLTSLGLGC